MRMQKIEDACTLHARIGWQGLTKAEYLDSGDYYLVTGVDFLDGVIDFKNCHYVTKDRYDQDSHIQLQENDVLVTKDGTIGKVAIVDKFDKPATLNSGIFVVRPRNEEALLPAYLVYALRSGSFNRFIEQIKVGCTIAHLNQAKFLKFEIPDIEVQEQRNVVDILSCTEEILKKRGRQLEELNNLIKSRFVEMFGTPIKNDKRWKICTASDACSIITDGSHFSPQGVENGYPMLSVKDMRNDGFHYDKCKLVSKEDYDVLIKQGCKPLKDDVLLAKDGSYFYYGFVLKEEIEQAVLSSIAILRPNKTIVNPKYLCNYMLSDQTVKLVTDNYVTGAALKRVILKGIKQIPVMLPPIEMQNQFAAFVEQVDKLKSEVQKSLEETQLLMDSLMQKYFG